MTDSDHLAALMRPLPGAVGSCAGSFHGIEDDIPIDGRGDAFENIAAIAKLTDTDGRVRGWVYRTTGRHLVVQFVEPPVIFPKVPGAGEPRHVYSPLAAYRGTHGNTLWLCTAADFGHHHARKRVR